MSTPPAEPWLRGPIEGVPPHLMPVFHSFAQVREDLELHTSEISNEQAWRPIEPIPALGFQLRHIAGSVDRLVTYLVGGELSDAQLAALKLEAEPGASLSDLLEQVHASL